MVLKYFFPILRVILATMLSSVVTVPLLIKFTAPLLFLFRGKRVGRKFAANLPRSTAFGKCLSVPLLSGAASCVSAEPISICVLVFLNSNLSTLKAFFIRELTRTARNERLTASSERERCVFSLAVPFNRFTSLCLFFFR